MSMKPFYKCLGGKTKLVPLLQPHIPAEFDTYIEPCFGGGALFCALYNQGRLADARCVIADADPSVAQLLRQVQTDPDVLFADLLLRQRKYAAGTDAYREAMYYSVRDRYNTTTRTTTDALFLRSTSFNGLWRFARKGNMNAPWGKYKSFKVPDQANLHTWQKALYNTYVVEGDCRAALHQNTPLPGMFVYVDPPYDGGFNAYTPGGFQGGAQADLIRLCAHYDRAGAKIILSNANTDFIRGTIRECWPTATVHEVQGKRTVAAQASARGTVRELIITGGAN